MHKQAILEEIEQGRASTIDASRKHNILPLTAQGLRLEIDGRELIRGINLMLKSGKRSVILGANGAGKSLLLRLLHGLIKPTGGSVLWNGNVADAAIASRQAMIFQRPVLLRRSARANIAFVLHKRHYDREKLDSETSRFLDLAGLSMQAETPARSLSGGEQQRLAIARALAIQPDILFLDEPSASLDPAATLAIEDLIQAAHNEGRKIVLVTHDIGQARRLADEIIFMHQGTIAEHRPAAAFFAAPSSAAATAFLAGRIAD